MKMNTFKEILNSFEAGDYQAFQMLMKSDKNYFQNAKKFQGLTNQMLANAATSSNRTSSPGVYKKFAIVSSNGGGMSY